MSAWYDRFGKEMPEDWSDKTKYKISKWQTDQRVGNTVVGDATVSTVWLGWNHAWVDDPPLIFETMVFGGEYDQEMARYSTEEQAMRGHLSVLDRLREGKPPFGPADDFPMAW